MQVCGAGLWYCNLVIGLLVSGFLAGILNMSIWRRFVTVEGDACQQVWRTGCLPDAARLSSIIVLAGPQQGLMG